MSPDPENSRTRPGMGNLAVEPQFSNQEFVREERTRRTIISNEPTIQELEIKYDNSYGGYCVKKINQLFFIEFDFFHVPSRVKTIDFLSEFVVSSFPSAEFALFLNQKLLIEKIYIAKKYKCYKYIISSIWIGLTQPTYHPRHLQYVGA
jgi:hypothetical protein